MAAADVIRDAAVQLREAGIETPEHDAKLLLAEAAGVELRDVDKALLMGEELGTAERFARFQSMLEIADATSFATLAQLDGTVDIVITNPPYVPQTDIPEQPEVRDWDPELALYGGSMDGTLIPERIIERACRLLKPGGALVMEHDVTQGDRLVAFARATGFAAASTGQDWTGRDRYLFAVS